MPSLSVLGPPTLDPQARVWSKLADLDARVQRLEVTPFLTPTTFTFSNGTTSTFTYAHRGGRLWVMVGGYFNPIVNGAASIDFTVNSTTLGTLYGQGNAGSNAAFSVISALVPVSALTVGGNNTFAAINGANPGAWNLFGMIFEWASA